MGYPIERKCVICGASFWIENFGQVKRKYCFTCSPIGRKGDYTPLHRAMKNQIIKERGGKCEKCGYNKCMEVLSFHHRDPSQKDFELSMKSGSTEWNKFKEEANKCDLLCANCHMETHYLKEN